MVSINANKFDVKLAIAVASETYVRNNTNKTAKNLIAVGSPWS